MIPTHTLRLVQKTTAKVPHQSKIKRPRASFGFESMAYLSLEHIDGISLCCCVGE